MERTSFIQRNSTFGQKRISNSGLQFLMYLASWPNSTVIQKRKKEKIEQGEKASCLIWRVGLRLHIVLFKLLSVNSSTISYPFTLYIKNAPWRCSKKKGRVLTNNFLCNIISILHYLTEWLPWSSSLEKFHKEKLVNDFFKREKSYHWLCCLLFFLAAQFVDAEYFIPLASCEWSIPNISFYVLALDGVVGKQTNLIFVS